MNKFLLSSGILCGVGALFIFISLAGPWLGDNDSGLGPTTMYFAGKSYDRTDAFAYDTKEEAAIAMIVLGGLVGIVGLVLAILVVLNKVGISPLIVGGLGFALAIFALIAVALYAKVGASIYEKTQTLRTIVSWLPETKSDHPGWAMFLALFALIFGLVSGILAVVSTKKQ